MKQKTDIFEARLLKLREEGRASLQREKRRGLRADAIRILPVSPRLAENSVLLPVASVMLLMLGAAAFGTMMFLPDLSHGTVAEADAESASSRALTYVLD